MANNKHLTDLDRGLIENYLNQGCSFQYIGQKLDKDPTTISKEIRLHYIVHESGSNTRICNPCKYRDSCTHKGDICIKCTSGKKNDCKRCELLCFKRCPEYEELECPKLKKPPYVCNNCERRKGCYLKKRLYRATTAQKEYEQTLRDSRTGISISGDELKKIDEIISPLVKKGQSIHHICVNHSDEIMLDEKTIYNYIEQRLLSIGNIDLPRKVRCRIRKKKKPVKVDKKCHINRNYTDFQAYTEANPDVAIVEMDSVEGNKGGKVLLTLCFTQMDFMLAFIREANTAASVTNIFEELYSKLGKEKFKELFPLILTDRGSEFTDPLKIEFDENGNRRTRVFYCDPQRSDQKGACEVTHELIRRIIPKGTSLDNLDQDKVNLMMSHINSYGRKKLNNVSSTHMFSLIFGVDTLNKLGIQIIEPDQINLTPKLLK